MSRQCLEVDTKWDIISPKNDEKKDDIKSVSLKASDLLHQEALSWPCMLDNDE